MTIICVDDEDLVLQLTAALCRDILPEADVRTFSRASYAMDWAAGNPVDIALLDIDMPGMNGLVLAANIKKLRPEAAVIFVTGYAQYAVEAFSLHAQGYLLKPISKERLQEEVHYALGESPSVNTAGSHIFAKTFGNFDILVDGNAVAFSRSKAKELLAYLVDRQGSSITRPEAAATLWEDSYYDRSMQKQLDVVIRSLRATLDEYGIGEILEIQRGFLRIKPELIDSDLYRFFAGDIDTINSYRGEYLTAYSWAEITAGYMDRKAGHGI